MRQATFHTLGMYFPPHLQQNPQPSEHPLTQQTLTRESYPRISIATERTKWTLTSLTYRPEIPHRRQSNSVKVILSPRSAEVVGVRGEKTEFYRQRQAVIELAYIPSGNGPATVSAILHTEKGLKLAQIAQDRAKRWARSRNIEIIHHKSQKTEEKKEPGQKPAKKQGGKPEKKLDLAKTADDGTRRLA